jgi:hypothetical protein
MTADERLVRIRVKVERAKKHIEDLDIDIRTFLESNPYQLGIKHDLSSQRVVYYLTSVRDTPLSISATIGDILHNLRSALDHLAYQLVDIGTKGKGPFHHVSFPILKDVANYRANSRKRIRGMRQDAIQAIDTLKPYKGGNETLWNLHRLNNVDKHRLLITVGTAYNSVDIGSTLSRRMSEHLASAGFDYPEEFPVLSFFVKPADRMFPLKAGDELLIDAPGEPFDPLLRFRFDIAFGEPQTSTGEPVLETLKHMAQEIDDIILGFRLLLS